MVLANGNQMFQPKDQMRKSKSKHKMIWARHSVDPILRKVIAEIHQTAETPPKGYLTREGWAKRWKLVAAQANIYLKKAIAGKLLEKRTYRIVTHGRLLRMPHFGPPDKKRKPC